VSIYADENLRQLVVPHYDSQGRPAGETTTEYHPVPDQDRDAPLPIQAREFVTEIHSGGSRPVRDTRYDQQGRMLEETQYRYAQDGTTLPARRVIYNPDSGGITRIENLNPDEEWRRPIYPGLARDQGAPPPPESPGLLNLALSVALPPPPGEARPATPTEPPGEARGSVRQRRNYPPAPGSLPGSVHPSGSSSPPGEGRGIFGAATPGGGQAALPPTGGQNQLVLRRAEAPTSETSSAGGAAAAGQGVVVPTIRAASQGGVVVSQQCYDATGTPQAVSETGQPVTVAGRGEVPPSRRTESIGGTSAREEVAAPPGTPNVTV
jgi:hypothetical protein